MIYEHISTMYQQAISMTYDQKRVHTKNGVEPCGLCGPFCEVAVGSFYKLLRAWVKICSTHAR